MREHVSSTVPEKPADPDGAPRRRQSAVRKQQIIQVTIDIIDKYGIQGASLAVLSRGVGVTDAALYKHFSSKGEILIAAYDSLAGRVFHWIESLADLPSDARFRQMAETHAALFSRDVSGFNAPMFQFNLWRPEDRLRDHVTTTQNRIMDAVARLVDQGKTDGSVSPDVDTDIVVSEIFAWIWWEDLSYLRGLDPKGIQMRSTEMFARILNEIQPTSLS
jgi:AcrR family transcriptional regulator